MSSLPLDVAPLLDDLDMGPLFLHRYSPPTQDAYGTWTTAPPTVLTLSPVVVHTVSDARTLEQLPEADRQRETVQVYTKQELRADGNDELLYAGRTWRVVSVHYLDQQGGVWIALAVSHDPAEEAAHP